MEWWLFWPRFVTRFTLGRVLESLGGQEDLHCGQVRESRGGGGGWSSVSGARSDGDRVAARQIRDLPDASSKETTKTRR